MCKGNFTALEPREAEDYFYRILCLQGVYVNNDMYISRFRQLAAVYGQGYTAKMFFNNDTA